MVTSLLQTQELLISSTGGVEAEPDELSKCFWSSDLKGTSYGGEE